MGGLRCLARRQAEAPRGNEAMAPRYAQAWERFLESGRVANFYQAWDQRAAGRTPFYSFVIPVGPYQELTERVRRVQLALRNLPGIDVVPYQSLHITVQMVGFEGQGGGPDELTARELAHLREDARSVFAERSAFRLRLGRANSFPCVAFIEVEDDGTISRLRQALQMVCPRLDKSKEPYLPHLSVGYYVGDMSNRRFAAALASFRDLEVGGLLVRGIGLLATPVLRARRFAPARLVERYALKTDAGDE